MEVERERVRHVSFPTQLLGDLKFKDSRQQPIMRLMTDMDLSQDSTYGLSILFLRSKSV